MSTRPGSEPGHVRPRPRIHGHRGARALAPENTVAGVAAAFEAGVDGIEIDVQLSADGRPVVWHDPVLDPAKCRGEEQLMGAHVWTTPWDELRRIDVGSVAQRDFPRQRLSPGARLVTLPELLAEFAGASARGAWWTIELKLDPTDPLQACRRDELVATVVDAVRGAGIARQCWMHSFDWACLRRSQVVAPDLPTSALAAPLANWFAGSPWLAGLSQAEHAGDLPGAAAAVGARAVAPHHSMIDTAFVGRARELGLAVLAWTVNATQDAARLAGLGVDVIVTDDPEAVRPA